MQVFQTDDEPMIAAHVRHFTRTRAGATHALEFFGGDTPPLDEKGCWFSIHAVDHDAHKIGGLLHVRSIPGHDHAAVMVRLLTPTECFASCRQQ